VCAIAPGVIETPMVAGLDEKNRTELERIIQQPKRPGRPEEFAALVGHIIDNADLNGEVIRLDGGLRMPPR
jgi:NAD(P)-dependent dehydrogenase (short-subunit alcohol dehydrogenase family)